MCFDFPYNFCLKHLILRTEPDMIKNVTVHKVPVNLIWFQWHLKFPKIFSKKKKKSWEEAKWELSNSKRTEMMQLIVFF